MTPPFYLVGEESPCLQPRLQVVIASVAKQSQANFPPGLPDTPSAGGQHLGACSLVRMATKVGPLTPAPQRPA